MFTTTARNWLTVLKTRFAVDARLKPTTAGRRKPRFRTAPAELLEQRQMLAGVVAASSTFDFNLFAANIAEQAGVGSPAGLQAEGYSFAISQRDESDPFGTFQSGSGSAGVARNEWDNGGTVVNAGSGRDQEIASISKTITAAAVLRVWQEQTADVDAIRDRLDDPILNYLPTSWAAAASQQFLDQNISIRDLLTHTSGMWPADSNTPPAWPGSTAGGIPGTLANGGYVYADLQQITQSTNFYAKTYQYWTINYAYFRVALPYMWANDLDSDLGFGESGFRDQLEAADNGQAINIDLLPSGVWNQIQDDFGFDASDLTGKESNMLQIGPDQLTASAYKTYVIQNVLPSTVVNPQTRTIGTNFTLLYQFPAPNGASGRNTGNQTLLAGSRGWNLSARDVERFLSALRYDDSLLLPETRDLMNSQFLGWQPNGNYVGDLGQYYGHNGVNFGAQLPGAPAGTNGFRNNTAAVTFPGGVQAVLFTNSQIGPQFGAAFNPAGSQNVREVALVDAYDNAWTDVVYAGDPISVPTGGDDQFLLRSVASNPTEWVELLRNGAPVLQRRRDTLHSLTINGLSGNDTVQIQDLPNGMELDVVFNGGSGNDTITVANLGEGVQLNLIVNGASGDDTVDVQAFAADAQLDLEFNGGGDDDTMNLDGLSEGAQLGFTFNGGAGDDRTTINALNLSVQLDYNFNGGGDNDIVTINDLPAGADFTFNGGKGDDVVTVARTEVGSIVTLHGGNDNDTVYLGTTGDLDDVRTTFLFVGGGGSDSLFVNDLNDSSPQLTHSGFHRDYVVRQNRVDRSGSGLVGQFSQLENVTLDASNQTSLIRLLSTNKTTDVHLNGNNGDDRIVLGSGLAATQLNSVARVSTGGGKDTLIVDDRNSQFVNEDYVLFGDHFQSQNIPLVYWGNGSLPERIRLRQNLVGTTTNVRNVLPGVRVDVEGNPGNDTINVHATEAGALLYVGGGERDDVINITPESQNADSIQGVVRAYGSSGTDRVILHDQANTDSDGRNYRVVGRSIDIIGSTFNKLIVPSNSATEFVEVRAGIEDDVFDVRTWLQTAELQLHGNSGSDHLNVAATTRTVDSINGDLVYFADPLSLPGTPSPDDDTAVIHDEKRAGAPNYDLLVNALHTQLLTVGFDLNSYGVEQATLNTNDTGNVVNVTGASSLLHKGGYVLNVGGGNDFVNVHAPVTATVFANGGPGNDSARLFGTNNDDAATLQGDQLDIREVMSVPTTTLIRNDEITEFRLDADNGLDVLTVEGVAGIDEDIVVQATNTPGVGTVTASPFKSLSFVELEDVIVSGNFHENDSLEFLATHQDDSLSINPVASGTTLQPFVNLTSFVGVGLLKLRDASNVGVPTISGLGGADTFRVTIPANLAANPIRNVRLAAGATRGDHDVLIVNYNSNAWPLTQPATNPNNGTLRFGNGPDLLAILFRDFEDLVGDLF